LTFLHRVDDDDDDRDGERQPDDRVIPDEPEEQLDEAPDAVAAAAAASSPTGAAISMSAAGAGECDGAECERTDDHRGAAKKSSPSIPGAHRHDIIQDRVAGARSNEVL